MKIIFLDVDGVLVIQRYLNTLILERKKSRDKFGNIFKPDCINFLNEIVEKTSAKIIISSTWKLSGLSVMKELFSSRGFKGEIIGLTPVINEVGHTRDDEIMQWMEKNGIPEKFAIIDDMRIGCFPKSFFKTESSVGITEEIKNKIINHLNHD